MATLAQTSLLTPVVRRLPGRLLTLLDAWSLRIAKRRAEQRREAGRKRAKVLARKGAGA
jgi:hypothetical protein